MFDIASSSTAAVSFIQTAGTAIGTVVLATLAVAGALLIVGFAYRAVKKHATGRKW